MEWCVLVAWCAVVVMSERESYTIFHSKFSSANLVLGNLSSLSCWARLWKALKETELIINVTGLKEKSNAFKKNLRPLSIILADFPRTC